MNNLPQKMLFFLKSPISWIETDGNSYNEWILSGEPVKFLLEKPFTDSPGTVFNYNSAAVHLLGIVLTKAVGMSIPDFADKNLFSKIGISKVGWEQFDNQNINGGSGIQLKPTDMAKLGQLILQKGKSGTQSIVSEDWIMSITDPAFSWRDNYGTLLNLPL